MNYDQLVAHFGGCSKAGDALGLDRRTVHTWSKRRIPSKWQIKIAAITDGDLKPDREARREAKIFYIYRQASA